MLYLESTLQETQSQHLIATNTSNLLKLELDQLNQYSRSSCFSNFECITSGNSLMLWERRFLGQLIDKSSSTSAAWQNIILLKNTNKYMKNYKHIEFCLADFNEISKLSLQTTAMLDLIFSSCCWLPYKEDLAVKKVLKEETIKIIVMKQFK